MTYGDILELAARYKTAMAVAFSAAVLEAIFNGHRLYERRV